MLNRPEARLQLVLCALRALLHIGVMIIGLIGAVEQTSQPHRVVGVIIELRRELGDCQKCHPRSRKTTHQLARLIAVCAACTPLQRRCVARGAAFIHPEGATLTQRLLQSRRGAGGALGNN